MNTLRYPATTTEATLSPTPIEVLIVSHKKDFNMLDLVATSAILKSKNPISSLTVIVPDNENQCISEILISLSNRFSSTKFYSLTESQVLGEDFVSRVKVDFANRAGWILQQFLTIQFTLNSSSAGVLQIDADTINLKDQIWLFNEERQVILCSTEYHRPYYEVVRKIIHLDKVPFESHVAHQMLMQPKKLRFGLQQLGIESISELYEQYLNSSHQFRNEDSRFCAKYELYAHLLIRYFPEKIIRIKMSNIAVPRHTLFKDPERILSEASKEFMTLSAHSYLGESIK